MAQRNTGDGRNKRTLYRYDGGIALDRGKAARGVKRSNHADAQVLDFAPAP